MSYKTFQQNILSPSEVLLLLFKEETNICSFCGGKIIGIVRFIEGALQDVEGRQTNKKLLQNNRSMTEKKETQLFTQMYTTYGYVSVEF